MTDNPKTIFLTGITGALGKELLHEFLTQTQHTLLLLVRGKRDLSPEDRVRKILQDNL